MADSRHDQIDGAKARELSTLLAASQEQFRSFMDHSPALAYMKDEDLRHIYANQPLLDGFGLSIDEFCGTTSRDFMSPEMGQRMDDADTAVLSGKADLLEVEVSVDVRGETRWFRDTKFAVVGRAGERRVGGIAMDVTERRRTEHELQQQAHFESLLSDISASFVNVPSDQMDATIAAALEQVGTCLELDRCTYGHLSLDGTEVHITHVWNRDPLDGVAASYAAADYPWFLTPFVTGQELLWSRSKGLPPASEADIQLLEALDMQCFAGIPVVVGDDVVGCLAFISCTNPRPWNPTAVGRLHLLSRIFGSAIERQRQDLELRKAYDEIRQLKEHLEAENIALKQEVAASFAGYEMVGKSPALREVLFQVEQVAATDSTVLLLGETGVGKELVARAIHAQSRRSDQTLVTVNCAALPSSLIESELFGHEKGAFTGAASRKIGRFEVADGGDDPARRDRGPRGRGASEAPTNPPGRPVREVRIVRDQSSGCTRHCGHEPRSMDDGRSRRVPRRSVLPSRGLSHPRSTAARAARRHSAARLVLCDGLANPIGQDHKYHSTSHDAGVERLRLAGQRARAPKRGGARHDHLAGV